MLRRYTVPVVAAAIAVAAACHRPSDRGSTEKGTAVTYTAPRFPAYLKMPDSIDALMPTARGFVRNKAWRGGLGLGAVRAGETVLVVHDADAEEMILQAIG